jgi:hypothetical protein
MMNQSKYVLNAVMLFAVSALVIGCGSGDEKEKIKAPVVQQRPAAPPKQTARAVDQLATSLSIDDRISLDENEAPRSEQQRIAILKFFNAMLHADSGVLKNMLSYGDQLELDAMIDAGLAQSMDDVSLVVLKTGNSPEGRQCVMAIYEIDMDYQVQLWYLDDSGNGISFTAAGTPPNLVDKLSGNWVQNYFDLKNKRAEIAQQEDEETSYTLAGELTSSDGSLGGNDNQQDGPGGPRGPGGPTRR